MPNQSTKEQIQNDLVKFMKAGEKDKVEIIRFAQSFIKQLEKDITKDAIKNKQFEIFN